MNGAFMLKNDVFSERQPQPAAFPFGGEVWFKNAAFVFIGYSNTVVGNADGNPPGITGVACHIDGNFALTI